MEYRKGERLIALGYTDIELYILWWQSNQFFIKRRAIIISTNMFKDGKKVIDKLKEVEIKVKATKEPPEWAGLLKHGM